MQKSHSSGNFPCLKSLFKIVKSIKLCSCFVLIKPQFRSAYKEFLVTMWTEVSNCLKRKKQAVPRITIVYIDKLLMLQNQTLNRENLIELLTQQYEKFENQESKREEFSQVTKRVRFEEEIFSQETFNFQRSGNYPSKAFRHQLEMSVSNFGQTSSR